MLREHPLHETPPPQVQPPTHSYYLYLTCISLQPLQSHCTPLSGQRKRAQHPSARAGRRQCSSQWTASCWLSLWAPPSRTLLSRRQWLDSCTTLRLGRPHSRRTCTTGGCIHSVSKCMSEVSYMYHCMFYICIELAQIQLYTSSIKGLNMRVSHSCHLSSQSMSSSHTPDLYRCAQLPCRVEWISEDWLSNSGRCIL